MEVFRILGFGFAIVSDFDIRLPAGRQRFRICGVKDVSNWKDADYTAQRG
jgi:hypothetical protein